MPVSPASGDAPIGAQPQTRWLKRVLIPFWVVRCLAMIFHELLYIALLVIVARNDVLDSDYNKGGYIASLVAIMVFIGLCLALDLTSMIMLGRHSLRPKTFLIFQVIESAIWLALIIMSFVGLAQSNSGFRRPSPISYILQIILLISFIGLLIYASVIYHRARKAVRSGNYAATPALPQDPEYHGTAYGGAGVYGNVPPPPGSVHSNPFATPYNRSAQDLPSQEPIEMGRPNADPRYYNPPAPREGVAELPIYGGPAARYG